MLRKVCILLAGLLFVAYCVGAYRHQYKMETPDYVVKPVNLLKGRALKKWNDGNFRAAQLAELEARHYQAPRDGLKMPDGRTLPAGTRLRQPDFDAIISDAVERKTPAVATLADPVNILALEGLGYQFRDPVKRPALEEVSPDDAYLFRGGEPIDKAAVDRLLEAGVKIIGVQGSPSPIGLELGTIIMVWAIFLGLVAAVKGTLVDPLLKIMAERRAETEAGAAQAKKNARDLDQYQAERRQRLLEAGRERHAKFQEGRLQAFREAEAILHAAKTRERAIRHDSLQELALSVEAARQEALGDAKALGRAAVAQVLGREV